MTSHVLQVHLESNPARHSAQGPLTPRVSPTESHVVYSMHHIPGEVVFFDEKYHLPELHLVLLHEGIPTHLQEETGAVRAENANSRSDRRPVSHTYPLPLLLPRISASVPLS